MVARELCDPPCQAPASTPERERERETERDREDGYVVPDDAGAGGGSHHSRLRVCVLPPYPGPH